MKIFISHSSDDKRFVRKLKDDLNENDILTWIDEDELNLGDSLSEKLDVALEDSSHFLIVLSMASVSSEWVRYELEKALKQKNSNLLQRIIPVKYKECDIPKELEKLLYADLSKETREVNGNRIQFVGPGYSSFLERLCKSVRNSEKKLSSEDKMSIKRDIKTDPLLEPGSITHSIVRTSYIVIGYGSAETRKRFEEKILSKNIKGIDAKNVRTVLLPPLLKSVMKDLKIGDIIHFSKNFYPNDSIGHFAGFRKDDLGLTLDYRLRSSISATKGQTYRVEINTEQKRFHFYGG